MVYLMKIGIISERLSRPVTGVSTYTYNLVKGLHDISGSSSIWLIDHSDHKYFKNINKILIFKSAKYFPLSSYIWYVYLQAILKYTTFDLDIIHCPENVALITKLEHYKKVITVHDSMYLFQNSIPMFAKMRYKLFLLENLKNSDEIISVSHSVKSDLVKNFKIPENKISVIYEAANKQFKPINAEYYKNTLEKYNIKQPFILYAGILHKHKNIPTLIKAFYKIKRRGIKHKLVIAGAKSYKCDEVFDIVNNLNLRRDIIFTGHVPNSDLPSFYSAADIFVYPSLYEGFGLAPLEAMACGAPVITSNTSSFPETIGDAGFLIDPRNVDAFADGIYDVLSDDELRCDMVQKSINRAKLFDWNKCAKETLNVYEEALNL